MAPTTLYYLISCLLLITAIQWLVDLIYLRLRGKTTQGKVYKLGTPEYARVIKIASNQYLLLWLSVVTLLALNVWYTAKHLLNLHTSNGTTLAIVGPMLIVVAVASFAVAARLSGQHERIEKRISEKDRKTVRKK